MPIKTGTVNINNANYLVEILGKTDTKYTSYRTVYVYANSTIINDMPVYSDILFVYHDEDETDDIEVIPVPNTSIHSTFAKDGTSYKKIATIENVPCITLRVYHPAHTKKIPLIYSAYSIIANKTFHWFARYEGESIGTSTQRTISNTIYDEYDEIVFIDPEYINKSGINIRYDVPIEINSYSKEHVKYVYKDENSNEVEVPIKHQERTINKEEYSLLSDYERLYHATKIDDNKWLWSRYTIEKPDNYNLIQYIDFKLLISKSTLIDNSIGQAYNHIDTSTLLDNESLNIVLFPVDVETISDTTSILYQLEDDYEPSIFSIEKDKKIRLTCDIEFVDGKINVVGKFLVPTDLTTTSTILDYYQTIYGVDCSKYSSYKINTDAEGYDEEDGNHTEMCKYQVIVATDQNFNTIIHQEDLYSNTVDDFSVPLVGLFDNWKEVPINVWVMTKFTDRYIGISLSSPKKLLTKDQIKYTMIESKEGRFNELVYLQQFNGWLPKEYKKDIEIVMTSSVENVNVTNFIDNIRCYIYKDKEEKDNLKIDNNTKVFYRPLFYRTEDSQNISIRRNVVQNIGINLNQYMTKVDSFVIKVGTETFREIARNGIYVIFEVNGSNLSETTYDVFTSESEYICTGNITYK